MVPLPEKIMYIEARPKNDLESLYDREEERDALLEYIERKEPLILITGFRRAGKTSLLKAVLSKYSKYSILIDLRGLGNKSYVAKKDVINLFQSSIQSFLDKQSKKEKLMSSLKTIRGVSFLAVGGVQFDFRPNNELDLPGLFEKLDEWAGDNKKTIVIAMDEAQELRKSKHIDMASIFASVYDNCRNIVLVLTGSEIGVLCDFLAMDDPNAPLYGRSKKDIEIKPLTHDQGIEFLQLGLNEQKIKKIDRDVLSNAVDELGGIIGWLNEFGLKCIEDKKVNKKFIEDIKKTGSKIAREEFKKFLRSRSALERYNIIMKNLSIKPMSWTELKKALESDIDSAIDGKNFSSLLDSLQKSGFIQELEKRYSIIDSLLEYSFRQE